MQNNHENKVNTRNVTIFAFAAFAVMLVITTLAAAGQGQQITSADTLARTVTVSAVIAGLLTYALRKEL